MGAAVRFAGWTARDWRKLLAMVLLSCGGMAMTVVGWRLIGLVADRSEHNPWALAYSLYGYQLLIALVFVSLGWAFGKMKGEAEGPAGIKVGVSGGDDDDDDSAPAGASAVAAAAADKAAQIAEGGQ